MKAPAIACTVSARWESFVPNGRDDDGTRRFTWRDLAADEPAEQLRASLGPERLTVWLPSGRRVVCRRARIARPGQPQRQFFHHWRDRFGDAHRITFELPADLVDGGAQ